LALVLELIGAGPLLDGCTSFASPQPADAPPAAKSSRTAAKLSAVGAAGLVGLGVFFAFDANTASHHDTNPSGSEQQATTLLTAAMYVSFSLALAAAITTVVLLLTEPPASP
jgi:hypothetical protein